MDGGRSNRGWIWMGTALLILLGLAGLAALLAPAKGPSPAGQSIASGETDPAVWGRSYPRQYHSWRHSQESIREDIGLGPGRTKWGGPRPQDASRAGLYAGLALARDGGPAQGTPRHPAVCADCHDPATLALRVSRRPFIEAMARRGIHVGRASRQAMRTYVCAQCHASHFTPGDAPRLPWDRGLGIDDILGTFSEGAPAKGYSDWTHALSGAPMIKLHHPEFELWNQGLHAARGVACADCHMPARREGTTPVSSHDLASPLQEKGAPACRTCHPWPAQEFRIQVERIQDRTAQLQERAAAALLAAHRAVGACQGAPAARLEPIRALIREAQARWDFIASEGSRGFHAPQEAARVLAIAIDQARQAERDALEAARKP